MDVRLRELRQSDLEPMLEWMNDPETVKYLGSGFIRGRSAESVRYEIELRLSGDVRGERYVIEDAETGEYLGQCDLLLPDDFARTVEVAVVIKKSAWGRGAAKKAMEKLLKRAFLELDYRRVYLLCVDKNLRALSMYEHLGFTREGVMRRHMLSGGEICDVVIMGMLREEYLALDGVCPPGEARKADI
ncbi:MAG: GNAT family N-acetyltransferase [Clostridia bacterium]|nr:GNAT family N-acetyltransferase [Clostridia bacterium]